MSRTPHVIIIGCGLGGLFAAQALRRAPVAVTVIDRTHQHLSQPLLYRVASAGLSAPAFAAPIRHVLERQRNATVLMGEVIGIDRKQRRVTLGSWELLTSKMLQPTEASSSLSEPPGCDDANSVAGGRDGAERGAVPAGVVAP
ncbi:MAG: FAD-dependent oxidoreductase, partial [Rubrivivax sp.]|nr:FAD-dependent oxidoreductase [Rubrivivax sp.]MCA3259977.1 FAD-dependent oxidoreductase [Rubrivivax sp.]